jgi:hypothetical protein
LAATSAPVSGQEQDQPAQPRTETVSDRGDLDAAQERTEPSEAEKTDDRLGERLIRKAVAGSDEDVMAGIIRAMNEAARKLEIDFNTGQETQELQRRALVELDRAIKAAAAQRRPRRQSGQSTSPDKRRMPTRQGDASKPETTAADGQEGRTPSDSAATGQTEAQEGPARGDLRELRRAWGHLPMREREEIIQGIGENYLEKYREWIERYYQALQEEEE